MMLTHAGGVISRIIFVAFFRLDVLIEVAALASTELIHQSSARITIVSDVFSPSPLRRHACQESHDKNGWRHRSIRGSLYCIRELCGLWMAIGSDRKKQEPESSSGIHRKQQ